MENDIRNENKYINDYFQLDFAKEDIKGNRFFEEFKKQRLKELGKDAKLFHCKKDNVLFYVSKAECKINNANNHYYCKKCPLCKNYICYFCERIRHNPRDNRKKCCVLSSLYYIFFINGFKFCKDYSQFDDYLKGNFKFFLILDLIPLTKCFLYSMSPIPFLFFGLLLKEKKWKKQIDNDMSYGDYICRGEENGIQTFFIIIFTLNGLVLTICFTIIAFYFNILILIISLFTKFYPLKYSVGLLNGFFHQ